MNTSVNKADRIAVCSRSFSKNKLLRSELLEKYSNVKFNDEGLKLHGKSLIEFLSECDKAIIALEKINDDVLSKLPKLKVISKYGVGLDMIDFNAMQKKKVYLGWTGGVNSRSVSELVIAFAITMLRDLSPANRGILTGDWKQYVGRQLTGRSIGIIGCGFVGKDLVKLLRVFGCKIFVNDIRDDNDDYYKKNNITHVPIEELLLRSEIVTIHTPLDDTTENILSRERLSMMSPNSVLINIARGGLVDESALKDLLIQKKIGAAAFDVFRIEPPLDYELLELSNFYATPHIGGSAIEAIDAMGRAAINGLDNYSLPSEIIK